ncbi:MAG: tRNA (guanosine(37)-N1)-methyltransferase TrmD [Planctomycetota bacterium]
MPLHVDILTIFPRMFAGVLGESILARAISSGLVAVKLVDIRGFATDRHRTVDDRPYGGGPGMVFRPEPVFRAVEAVLARDRAPPEATRKIILTPQGRRLDQKLLRELSEVSWIVILSGHYEGFDERIVQGISFEEVSIGDYVLSGGEIPAMVILDGVVRLLPGALGHPASAREDSFETGLLDFPQYTRPRTFRGMDVPEVLLCGDHRKIEEWRREQALRRTAERRRDLLEGPEGAGGVARPATESGGSERTSGRGVRSPRDLREALGGPREAGVEGRRTWTS